jgi:hypothetical protein
MNEKNPGRTGLLSDQSAVRAMNLDDVRLTYAPGNPSITHTTLPAAFR